jgi:hypothetical protein
MGTLYRGGAKYGTTLIIAPAHISVLDDVLAWFIVPWMQLDVSSLFPPCIGPSRP